MATIQQQQAAGKYNDPSWKAALEKARLKYEAAGGAAGVFVRDVAMLFAYRDPQGAPPKVLPGGKEAVTSSSTATFADDRLPEGIWARTKATTGQVVLVFIADQGKIGARSLYRREMIVQFPDQYRQNFHYGSIAGILRAGFPR